MSTVTIWIPNTWIPNLWQPEFFLSGFQMVSQVMWLGGPFENRTNLSGFQMPFENQAIWHLNTKLNSSVFKWFNHLNTGLFSPVFKWHSKSRPFSNWTLFDHSNTGLVWYSDGQKLSSLQMVWYSNGIWNLDFNQLNTGQLSPVFRWHLKSGQISLVFKWSV